MENQGISTPFNINGYERYVNAAATNPNLGPVTKERTLTMLAANIFNHSLQAGAGLGDTQNAFMAMLERNNISKDSIQSIITGSFWLLENDTTTRITNLATETLFHPNE